MKKKVLITVDTYPPKKDGIVIFLEEVVPALSEEYDITIAAPIFDKEPLKPMGNATVIGFPISQSLKIAGHNSIKPSRKAFKKIKNLVKEADIVWAQDLGVLGIASIHYGKKYKKPVFNYVHQVTWEHFVHVMPINNFFKRIILPLARRFINRQYRNCSVLMVPYAELAIELKKRKVFNRKVIIPLGVNIEKFKPAEKKSEAKEKLGFDSKTKIIGYCGRISREKDLPTLKRAFEKLGPEFKGAKLLIVGSGPDSEMNKLKGSPNIHITGFVENVVPYLQAMDIFVMPSLTETTSLATIEAMSCSLPVLATRVGYIKDYIKPRENGMFIGKGNSYILSKKIELLLKDKFLRSALGNNARNTIIRKFSWQKAIDDIKKAFELF